MIRMKYWLVDNGQCTPIYKTQDVDGSYDSLTCSTGRTFLIGSEISTNGSNTTDEWPQCVHVSVLFICPTNVSTRAKKPAAVTIIDIDISMVTI